MAELKLRVSEQRSLAHLLHLDHPRPGRVFFLFDTVACSTEILFLVPDLKRPSRTLAPDHPSF